MLMIPNIIWTKNKPKDYEQYVKHENRVLLIFERMGEVSVVCISLIFRDFNVNTISGWSLILLTAFLMMILYEIYWIKYFNSDQTMNDFYGNFLGIPVPGATLPVMAFVLLGVYGKNLMLVIATFILAIGHIGIHIGHKKAIHCDTM